MDLEEKLKPADKVINVLESKINELVETRVNELLAKYGLNLSKKNKTGRLKVKMVYNTLTYFIMILSTVQVIV